MNNNNNSLGMFEMFILREVVQIIRDYGGGFWGCAVAQQ